MIRPLYERVNIVSVDLVAMEARTLLNPRRLPETPPVLTLDADATASYDQPDGVVATVDFSITARDQSDGESVLELRATYRATYRMHEAPDGEPPQGDLDRFAHVSGIFTCWPFLRELAASMYSRMNLPLPLVPTLPPSVAAGMPWHKPDRDSAEED